jgi:enamine deaminase RidA (YjgF/YER057c/UK114 family)
MVEQELARLGLVLPKMPTAVASYVVYKIAGHMVFVSGQLPMLDGQLQYKGKIGKEFNVQQGADAARLCAQNILSALHHAVQGDWSRVKSVVRIGGFVNCGDSFEDHPKVINGASNLFVAVFGEEIGRHSRAAVGVNSLPLGAAVEVDAVFELA